MSEKQTLESGDVQSFFCDDMAIKPGLIIETEDGEIDVVKSYMDRHDTALFAGQSDAFRCDEVHRVYKSWDKVPTPPQVTEFIEIL